MLCKYLEYDYLIKTVSNSKLIIMKIYSIFSFILLVSLLFSCDSILTESINGTQQVESQEQKVDRYLIEENGKFGYIDHLGNEVIKPQFDEADVVFGQGLAPVKNGNKWGYIDTVGNYVINPQFDEAIGFDVDSIASVKVGNKWGYINKDGIFAITPQFDYADCYFIGKYASVRYGNKWGFIDRDGKLVINPQFDWTDSFSEGLAAVKNGDKWGYIDEDGRMVINPQFEEANWYVEGLALVEFDGKYGFINQDGKYVINPQFDYVSPYYSTNGLTIVKVDEKYGFLDKNGKYVINPQFDGAYPFSEGLSAVKIADRWGFITDEGKYVINPQFESASYFYGDLAHVKIGGKYGYINKEGRFIINPQFDYAEGFYGGVLAEVRIGGTKGYINKEGVMVWQSQIQDNNVKSNQNTKSRNCQTQVSRINDSQCIKGQDAQWPIYSIPGACSITVPPAMELRDDNSSTGKLFSVINPSLYKLLCDGCDVFSDHSKIVFQPEGMNSDNPQDIDRATATYARIIIEFGYNYDVSQEDIKSMTTADLVEYDDAIGKQYKSEFDYAQQALGNAGSFVWHPTKREKIGGKYCMVLDYDRSGLQGMVKVKKYLFYYNGKEIDITCSYRISEKQKYEKDFEKVIRSIKFD